MSDKLSELRQISTIVADTGDISAIKRYLPEDATTNPSLILKAAQLDQYRELVHQSIKWAKTVTKNREKQIKLASEKIAVEIGTQILKIIKGKISTEVDASLSYNTDASVQKARQLIQLYENAGVKKDRVLIKLAATWEGIKAAEQLEKEGISCNLTLIFSFAQARASAEAGVFLISPFVGRILDWYVQNTNTKVYSPHEDPGVVSVSQIYNYYKKHGYKTVVMGASFRNIQQVLQLAGCDKLTISPHLLDELMHCQGTVKRKLSATKNVVQPPVKMSESEFHWQHNTNKMAVEKLSDGIRNFFSDQEKLYNFLNQVF